MINFKNIGFDFGIKPGMFFLNDIEFSTHFTNANCVGVLYVFGGKSEDDAYPVQLMFLFENDLPAEKFFNSLLRWIEKSGNDGDAVSIDFIENNDGGYTIAISPEYKRFADRMIPENLKERVSPRIMISTQYKKIDVLSPSYLKFKENYSRSDSIVIAYVIGDPTHIKKKSAKYFQKKEFNFYTENNIPQDSMLVSYKAASGENPSLDLIKKPPKELPEEIYQYRVDNMKTLLPITYHKLSNRWLALIQDSLISTFDKHIIWQAIANLVVFERLQREKGVSPEFLQEGHLTKILDYLTLTYESFESYYPPDDFFTEEKVRNQIENDNIELQKYLKE